MHVLLCWELGSGLGHLRRLAPLAQAMIASGHRVSLAARDVVSAAGVFDREGVPVLPAPFCLQGPPPGPGAASYPEVLLRVGYTEPAVLAGLLRPWVHLLEMSRAQLVVGDHAPSALLAARLVGIPAFAVGTGFSVPPATVPMPPFAAPAPPPASRLQAAETRVRRVIEQAWSGLSARGVPDLAELFAPERSFLCTYPELDHHGPRADQRYWGVIEPAGTSQERPDWPPGKGPRVFAYLHHGYRQFPGLTRQLRELGHPTVLVSPGIPEPLRATVEGSTLRVQSRGIDLRWAARQAQVCITHCGHATTARLLLLGRPLILLPNYVEQTVLAYRLARQGLALMMHPDPQHHRYGAAITQVLTKPAYGEHVQAFAQHWAGKDGAHVPADMVREMASRS